MSIMDDDLVNVMQRFPERKARIDKLYLSNEDFQLLCSDYYECVTTLNQLIAEDSQKSILDEYRSLKLALEKEILNYLDASTF
jgi:hypothetical protein